MSKTKTKTITFEVGEVTVEATKSGPGDPWDVSYDHGAFRFYGSATQMKAEAKARIATGCTA